MYTLTSQFLGTAVELHVNANIYSHESHGDKLLH